MKLKITIERNKTYPKLLNMRISDTLDKTDNSYYGWTKTNLLKALSSDIKEAIK